MSSLHVNTYTVPSLHLSLSADVEARLEADEIFAFVTSLVVVGAYAFSPTSDAFALANIIAVTIAVVTLPIINLRLYTRVYVCAHRCEGSLLNCPWIEHTHLNLRTCHTATHQIRHDRSVPLGGVVLL